MNEACCYCDTPLNGVAYQRVYCSRCCMLLERREDLLFAWRRQDLNRPEIQAKIDILKQRRRK